jgi:dipeptidyl aminopeptidase/acylaminoacyl peptidase
MVRSRALLVRLSAFSLVASAAFSADIPHARQQNAKFTYQKPPAAIRQVLESPAPPLTLVSPTHDRVLVIDSLRHPPVSDLAQPMLRIAGLRINPATNGRHHPPHAVGLRIVSVADGKEMKVTVPANAWIGAPEWAPDGRHFVFTNTAPNATELWIADAATGSAHKVPGVKLNTTYGTPVQWFSGSKTLLVQTVPAGRGAAPKEDLVPAGPNVQESAGKGAPIPTYEDLLKTRHDEELFDYYVTSQLATVDTQSGAATNIGAPAIFESIQPSPDGRHLLVERVVRPYSFLLPAGGFAKDVEVWSVAGKSEHTIATLPNSEQVPLEGVLTGPRDYTWVSTRPATLVWAEALDEGNPKKKADFRDRLLMLSAPFSAEPTELAKVQYRFQGGGFRSRAIEFGEKGDWAFIHDYDRTRRWTRTLLIHLGQPGAEPKVVWERSIRDRYGDPGTPVMRTLPNGHRAIAQNGEYIFLEGEGASSKGDYPFLDRYSLETRQSERLFHAAEKTYEQFVALLNDDGSRFLTRYETPTDPPNLYVHTSADQKSALTHFPDPAPQLRGITKQLVTYKRDDGVQLSFELYLPANYKQGERLPTIVWAYPLEYTDAATASQVSGSQYRFTTIGGISELFLVTQGYAVLDNATMPVVGDPETMNDTYVQQIVSSAKAAIDKAAEMGVTDPNRVGVGGHSYGAFMTANLLAHSNLFKAGVARSGAYNRTLTPFGFQSERRTFWEAEDTYMKVSPFAFADKIKAPILLIHGEADDNSGTFPIQSERMYQAIKGNGGTVRYVTLPYEAHGYVGLESVEHVQWEMLNWFDKWVKNAPESQRSESAGK